MLERPTMMRPTLTALAFVALLSCTLLVVPAASGAVTNPATGSESASSTTDDGNSTASTTGESTTTTAASDSTGSSSTKGSNDSTTNTKGSGSTSSNSSTTDSSESSSKGSSTSTSGSSGSGTTKGGSSNSSTTDESGSTSSDSSTTDESGTTSSDSSTTDESGTTSSDSSTTDESGTSSDSSTTDESGTTSSDSSTSEESGTTSSNSSTTASNSGTTKGPGSNSANSSTTLGGSSSSTTNGGSSSGNSSSSGSSSGTTSGSGSTSGGNGTSSASSNSSTASPSSGSAGGSTANNVSSSGIFLQPGNGKSNYDITKNGEYFDCGGSKSEVNVRLVARYDMNATADKMKAYLNNNSEEFKAEQTKIGQIPKVFPDGKTDIYLVEMFTLSLARKVEDDKVEFEIFCKLNNQREADVIVNNLTATNPYTTWDNLRFSKACDMQPNRVVPIAMKFTAEIYNATMRDRTSLAFTNFAKAMKPSLLERLQSQVPAITDLLVLSISNGSVVVETAVMVDRSGTTDTSRAVQNAANDITMVNGMPTQSVQTTQREDYVAAMDTVNAAPPSNTSKGSADTNLIDDRVPGITTESPNNYRSHETNGYFLNVTVPSFLALILVIAIFLFCTVNSNSCLCQLCASNVKKEVKLV